MRESNTVLLCGVRCAAPTASRRFGAQQLQTSPRRSPLPPSYLRRWCMRVIARTTLTAGATLGYRGAVPTMTIGGGQRRMHSATGSWLRSRTASRRRHPRTRTFSPSQISAISAAWPSGRIASLPGRLLLKLCSSPVSFSPPPAHALRAGYNCPWAGRSHSSSCS